MSDPFLILAAVLAAFASAFLAWTNDRDYWVRVVGYFVGIICIAFMTAVLDEHIARLTSSTP